VIDAYLARRVRARARERTPYELAQEAGFIGCIAGHSAGKAKAGSTKERVVAAIRKKHGKKSAQ